MTENENGEIDLTSILEELDAIDYKTLGEKARNNFDVYYTQFKEQFSIDDEGNETSHETKSEMINATYTMSLESLNNALQYLEYSYTLILAIRKASDEHNLYPDDLRRDAMALTNNFIETAVDNVNMDINKDLSKLLIKMKESENGLT
jgi:hypothetical protein